MSISIIPMILILSTALALQAPAADSSNLPAIDARMKDFIDQHEIAGAVTLIATRDGIVHLGAVGHADIASNTPLKPDSLFWIASMTKPLTATAILMLQEEGKLSVDDPVSKYLPDFANLKTADGNAAVVTLRHCLTHSSGMTDVTPDESKTAKSLADLMPFIILKPLKFQPGSKWEYNQAAINTLGRIIEVASGQSYPDFLQKRLLDPLAMKDTTFYPTQEQAARLAKSYRKVDDKLIEAPILLLHGADPTSRDRYPAANGGLFSTASDYAQFFRMILNNGTLDGKQYLKPETIKLMTTVQSGDLKTGFTPGHAWGLGWCVVRQPQGVTAMLSPGTFGHGGAYGTQAWIDPKNATIFILMVQRANFPNSDDSVVRKGFQEAAIAALKK